jgi:hypothetical protein
VASYAGAHGTTLQLQLLGDDDNADDAATTTVEIALTVRPFALPLSPRLRNTIQLDVSHLQHCHPGDTPARTEMRYLEYAEFLLREMRLNPGSIYDDWGPQDGSACDYRGYQSCFVPTAGDLERWVTELGMNAFTLPWQVNGGTSGANTTGQVNMTSRFIDELRARNISHLANFYGFDEYSANMSAIGTGFAPLKAAFPEVTTLTSAHIGSQFSQAGNCGMVPERFVVPLTPDVVARLHVDAVVPQTNYMPLPRNRTELQRAGRQVWTYISAQPYRSNTDWRLDNPLIDGRMLPWQLAANSIDGLLYWGFNQWACSMIPIDATASDGFISAAEWQIWDTETPWLQGDGKLLYCGDDATGPVASTRLINVRDGFEDYDYIAMLQDLNPAAAQRALESAALNVGLQTCGPFVNLSVVSPQRNGTVLGEVRELMAAEIELALRQC